MKNSITAILLSVTLAFAAFTAGYFLGQHSNGPDINISGIPLPTQPSTPATASTSPTSPSHASTPVHEATDPSDVPATEPTSQPTEPDVTFPLDINTATLEQLQLLPGIGPVLAQRIIDYRNEIGGFTCVEELDEVKGIGQKILEKLLDLITVLEVST